MNTPPGLGQTPRSSRRLEVCPTYRVMPVTGAALRIISRSFPRRTPNFFRASLIEHRRLSSISAGPRAYSAVVLRRQYVVVK